MTARRAARQCPPRSLASRLSDDAGFAPAELVLWTGLILLPTLILVASLPTWWERQSLARLAAQEAARAVALADDWEAGAINAGQVVAEVAANHQVPPGDVVLTDLAGSLDRGASVSATVSVRVPAMAVPFLVTVPAFEMSVTHTELVDAYRSLPTP
jgi:hypothetical protein